MLIEKIQELLNLIDQKNILDKKMLAVQNDLSCLKTEIDVVFSSKNQIDKELKELKRSVKIFEEEITSLVDLGRSLKGRIGSLLKHREIDATKQELLVVQSKQEVAEDNLLKSLNKIEKIEKSLKSNFEEFTIANVAFSEKERILNKFQEEIMKDLLPIINQLHESSASLPEEFVNKYRRILSKMTNPIVAIKDNSCSACYTTLTPQLISTLKKSRIGECAGCGRVLFYL